MAETDPDAPRLSAALEAKLLARLRVEWRGLNYRHFKSALRPPVLGLVDDIEEHEPLARWTPEERSVELSRTGLFTRAWSEVLDALIRAAVWQYIDERLNVDPRNRHPSYRRICRHLGLERPDAPEPTDAEGPVGRRAQRRLARVRKLLALARSPNRHEAETAAMTARRLMLEYNIDEAQPALEGDEPRYGHRQLGPPELSAGRRAEHERRLAKILSAYFFVESVWLPIYIPRLGRPGTVLEICGLEPNLAMAAHVHGFVRASAERLWRVHLERSGVEAHERLAFLAGVMAGFEDKLARQDEQLREQGLVWVPAPGLEAYFRRRYPKLQYTRTQAGPASEAFEAGSRAGQRIVLSTPVGTQGPTRRGPPRALPPAR